MVRAVTTGSTVAVGVDFKDSELATRIRTGVARIADLTATELSEADEALARLAPRLACADVRSVRALITVACAETGIDPQAWDVAAAGSAVEMIHLATVQHHEVVESPRAADGCQTVERWHNDIAILAGDYLLATASRVLARLGPAAVNVIAESFARTVTGQMRAERRAEATADLAGHCLRVVSEVTGSLTATAGYFGAIFSGATGRDIARTKRLGKTIGTALQISDDIDTITNDAGDCGAPDDTFRRRYSLPVLYALHEGGPGADRLRRLLSDSRVGEGRDARDREVLALVRASAGVTEATRVVAHYAKRAEDDLAGLPDNAGRRALSALVDHVHDRRSN